MDKQPASLFKRVLDPYGRISETLFGLIMVLTITGAVSAAESGRLQIRTMLLSALGCNLAWGIIDAIMYLMNCLADRSSGLRTLKSVRRAATSEQAQVHIASALPPLVASVLRRDEFEKIQQRLNQLPEPPAKAGLNARDYIGATAVFLLVFLSTFPVVIPFIVMKNVFWALQCSRLVAVVMLFLLGWAFGRCTDRHPWTMGLIMVIIGIVLVALAMALGG